MGKTVAASRDAAASDRANRKKVLSGGMFLCSYSHCVSLIDRIFSYLQNENRYYIENCSSLVVLLV